MLLYLRIVIRLSGLLKRAAPTHSVRIRWPNLSFRSVYVLIRLHIIHFVMGVTLFKFSLRLVFATESIGIVFEFEVDDIELDIECEILKKLLQAI